MEMMKKIEIRKMKNIGEPKAAVRKNCAKRKKKK